MVDPDLAVCDGRVDLVSVLLGNGDGTFAAKTDYTVGTHPSAVAIGDLTGDGDSRPGGGERRLLHRLGTARQRRRHLRRADRLRHHRLAAPRRHRRPGRRRPAGPGGGRLHPALRFRVPRDGRWVARAEERVRGVGRPGVAGGRGLRRGRPSRPGRIERGLQRGGGAAGDGTGAFGGPATFDTGRWPAAFAVADVNGGGKLDLVVANTYSGTVGILMGNGDGTFGGVQECEAGLYPRAVAAGDLDADGAPDLAVANSGGGDVSVSLGNGDGTFAARSEPRRGNQPLGRDHRGPERRRGGGPGRGEPRSRHPGLLHGVGAARRRRRRVRRAASVHHGTVAGCRRPRRPRRRRGPGHGRGGRLGVGPARQRRRHVRGAGRRPCRGRPHVPRPRRLRRRRRSRPGGGELRRPRRGRAAGQWRRHLRREDRLPAGRRPHGSGHRRPG